MFQTAVVLSVLLAFTAWLFRGTGKSVGGPVCWIMLWSGILFLVFIISPPPAVGWLFLFLIAALATGTRVKFSRRQFAAVCGSCFVLAFVVAIVGYIPVYREHQRILARFPAVDLKPRLAYELAASPTSMATTSAQNVDPDADALNAVPAYQEDQLRELTTDIERLHYRYGRNRNDFRSSESIRTLAELHQGFVADFIAQPSVFGYGRMPTMKLIREFDIERGGEHHLSQPAELIPQPAATEEITASPPDLAANAAAAGPVADRPAVEAGPPTLPPIELLQNLNRSNIVNFASEFSVVDERLQARAFQPHAFREQPGHLDVYGRPSDWRLQRLELVSLLKHNPPAVYVSEHLPAMNELADAATRPTTAFEVDAISRLRKGEEIVTGEQPDELRLVGAIRAVQECKKCHQVPLGGLLGAFSYRFRSTRPAANPVKVKVPKPLVLRGWRLGNPVHAG